MYKLVLSVVMLILVLASIGCQQAGLSEEEVRSIVREEVTRQIASKQVKDIVGQEVTTQLANVDDIVRQEVTTQLSSIDELTLSKLSIMADGKLLAYLGPDPLTLLPTPTLRFYVEEEVAVNLGSSIYGDGYLWLFDGDGRGQAFFGEGAAGFTLYLWNRYGENYISLDTDSDGNGYFLIRNKNGELTFMAP